MTDRNRHFEGLKALAREKRVLFGIETTAFGLREIRQIYSTESIKIDSWKLPAKIKAVYMCEDGAFSVAIQPDLPKEPKLFALVHELKHHYRDQELLSSGTVRCGDYNANELIEIGAEVFAAEFIYPENEFKNDAEAHVVGTWTAEDIVRFKRDCSAVVSYTFIRKRLERLRFVKPDQLRDVHFKKLEVQMYGTPFYKKDWFKKARARKT